MPTIDNAPRKRRGPVPAPRLRAMELKTGMVILDEGRERQISAIRRRGNENVFEFHIKALKGSKRTSVLRKHAETMIRIRAS